jgi:hypothetical protein
MKRAAAAIVMVLLASGNAAADSITAGYGVAPADWSGDGIDFGSGAPGGDATTGVGGGTFNLNSFLGADRYYAAGVTGQNTVSFNLEAGHFWNDHETLQHVTTTSTNFVNAASTFGGGGITPLYDRHATWAAMLIGGRQTAVNPQLRQQGIAHGTTLRSAAIATGWSGNAYALNFDITTATYQAAFNGAYGAAQVINSSYGYPDASGTNSFTRFTDARAFANPGTLHVVSAGNSGSGTNTVGAPGSGYNTLTVAALGSANTFNSVASFSSRAPQDYGYVGSGGGTTAGVRAAVDLAAPGESITSAFYGGQNGGNNTTLAGSTDQGSSPTAYSNAINGTSFAAPLVAGGAALVASAAATLAPLTSNTAASQSMVVKSLLLTGADKTAGWSNGQATVTLGGTTFIQTTQSVDWAVGAGRMNLDRTFDIQVTGQTDVAGTATGLLGDVAELGWDFGNSQITVNNDYLLPTLVGGSTFTATLNWMRNRSGTTVTGAADQAQANLNLSLWQLDSSNAFSTLIARSGSLYNTVEHLHLDLPFEARYGLRVEYPNNSFDLTTGSRWGNASNRQTYGLAWNAVAVPEPATWVLALAGLAAVAFREGLPRPLRRRRWPAKTRPIRLRRIGARRKRRHLRASAGQDARSERSREARRQDEGVWAAPSLRGRPGSGQCVSFL